MRIKSEMAYTSFDMIDSMADNSKNLSPEERYQLIGKLIEEVKLRRYSYQTGKTP